MRAEQGQPAPVGNVSSEAGQASDLKDTTFSKTARCSRGDGRRRVEMEGDGEIERWKTQRREMEAAEEMQGDGKHSDRRRRMELPDDPH